ncbi:UvrABC system protein A [Striga asiatica]|uniref:UvrABC system protein A n=1 Tax=Striga asiatica TaxID=4170 RepID=A0A5A7Q3C4_STRAF|nr:UvrABC system protein A [Striga asiatica]
MDSAISLGRTPNPNPTRWVWTFDEERALVSGLKDLVARGWKCDNGFRSGYTTVLEQHIRQLCPGSNIKAEPHICSKITAQPKAKPLRGKSFSFYSNWLDIFGKDHATGEGAQGFVDAVKEVLSNDGDCTQNNTSRHVGGGGLSEGQDNEVDSESAHGVESTASGGIASGNVIRIWGDQVVGLISTLCEKTDQRLSQLVARVGFQQDAKEQRQIIVGALKSILSLSRHQKFTVAKYLCKNNDELDFVLEYLVQGWTLHEERVCYRLFFGICRATPNVDQPAVFNSLWSVLARQVSEAMHKKFSIGKVKAKINMLHTHFREFQLYLTIPGTKVVGEGGHVRVSATYWIYVGQVIFSTLSYFTFKYNFWVYFRVQLLLFYLTYVCFPSIIQSTVVFVHFAKETDYESFFRRYGFPWYNECVELGELCAVAEVDMARGPGCSTNNPLDFQNLDEYDQVMDEPVNGENQGDQHKVVMENMHVHVDEENEVASRVEVINIEDGENEVANRVEVINIEDGENEVANRVKVINIEDGENEVANRVEVINIEDEEEPESMKLDTDVESCVDSE